MALTLDQVLVSLRNIKDSSTGKDFLSLGMIKDLKIDGETVSLKLTMRSPDPKERALIENQITAALKKDGAVSVQIKTDADLSKSRKPAIDKMGVPGVKHIIAVSSGKGGVGKSTVATNLAVALGKNGFKVGLLDTDIYGPNIPTMMGMHEQPHAVQDEKLGEMLIPLEAYGIKLISMGNLTKGDQPLVWRGPMLHSVVSQFLLKVKWGELDYLVVDMPPGTGDVQLSLTQLVPVSGAVIVTTPQEVALQDVRKAILMFEKVNVPILGIVENMSYFVCDSCDKHHEIFGSGGGQNLSEKYRVQMLGKLPLSASVREAGDAGAPIVAREPNSFHATAFIELAKQVHSEVEFFAHASGTESGAGVVNIGQF